MIDIGSFNSVGGGGSDDMVINSLVIMVGVCCLPFLQRRWWLGKVW